MRYVNVAGGGDELVGVFAGEGWEGRAAGSWWLGEEGDHVAHGHLGGGLGVFAEAHGDELGGSLGEVPEEARGAGLGFVDDELEGSGELGLEGGDVDLAVALSGVTVSGFEGSCGVDRVEGGGAGYELLVVHVAAVHPGWGGVVLAAGGQGDAHGAEEGVEGDGDAGGEGSGHTVAVEGDDAGVGVGEVVGEEAATGTEGVAGPGHVDGDLEDADLEDVAGFGLFDGDGAGEDVAAGAAFGGGDFGVDVGYVGGDVGGFDAEGLEALGWAAGGEGLHDDGVAGVDGEGWFGASGVVAPGYGGGHGEEGLPRSAAATGGEVGGAEENACGKDIRYGFSVVHLVSVSLPVGEGLGCSPPSVILRKFFEINALGPDLNCKVLILKETCCKFFQIWDLAAVWRLRQVWIFGLSPCVYYMGGVKQAFRGWSCSPGSRSQIRHSLFRVRPFCDSGYRYRRTEARQHCPDA